MHVGWHPNTSVSQASSQKCLKLSHKFRKLLQKHAMPRHGDARCFAKMNSFIELLSVCAKLSSVMNHANRVTACSFLLHFHKTRSLELAIFQTSSFEVFEFSHQITK